MTGVRSLAAAVTLAVAAWLAAAEPPVEEFKVEWAGSAWLARPVAKEDFRQPDWAPRWKLEGEASVAVREGALEVTAIGPAAKELSATLWWHETLPRDVLIEATGTVLGPAEANAANLNVIVHARESDGRPYRPGRSGAYRDYQSLPNYIFTLTGGTQPGWARVRRNPGFSLLAENPAVRSEVGRTYRLRVVVAGGRMRYWVNDSLVHDATDPDPLPGGSFALRTWQSRVAWSNVRIYALSPANPSR